MAVKIRFSRIGKKNAPFYRIVAIDSRRKRDGESLEILGTYNPLKGEIVQFHDDKIQAWVQQGAIMTDAVKRLQKIYRSSLVQAQS
ncbi:MAG: 30S ribosomal protein S16 [Candidatus Babeliaceae bacterium]|jgi:small subunit ribosomal protein S16